MSNDNGTGSAPSAVAVTVASGKLSSAPASNLVWKMEKTKAGYVFHKDDETWLYATDTNNGLRVGNGAAKEVLVEAETGYMYTIKLIGVATHRLTTTSRIRHSLILSSNSFFRQI